MKTLLSFVSASVLAVSSSFAQVPGIPGLSRAPVASGPQGTTLGANTTSGAGGIDLANRVKLRGYVDFMYANIQNDDAGGGVNDEAGFNTAADVDFLFDFSPVTAELHTNLSSDRTVRAPGGGSIGSTSAVALEQAFIRYNVNRDFSISMGRQLSTLGFEGDEAPNLYQVSNAYLFGDGTSTASLGIPSLRRNYVDGIRGNFNNGRFGFSLGLHNALFPDDGSTKSGDVAVDLQAAIMILPGLEGRLGYAHESVSNSSEIEQFNAWLAYNDRALTLAIEYDNWDIRDVDAWDIMLMGNYQFNDFFGLTLRYSHEDFDTKAESDRITLYTSFTVTDNLSLGLEYSHASVDQHTGADYDVDEFYAESLLSF
ncbi:MAG: hypothetical protein HN494_09595 [Opitutae bacterium]|jgi:hypothetical protein|nr:hypothetical protein [Opitutae bacterium]MBT5910729.1 hypothetical protein [Opitutae bacterium]MBT7740203.1 hypothetical protein [Opitutae bacterium]